MTRTIGVERWTNGPRGWLAGSTLWLFVSAVAVVFGWRTGIPAPNGSIAGVALGSAALAAAIRWLWVGLGRMPRVWSPGLLVTATAIAWASLLVGRVWTGVPYVPSAIARPEEVLGDLPLGYRYVSLPEAELSMRQAAPPGWHYALKRVTYGDRPVAGVVLSGWEGGAHVAYMRAELERIYGVWLPPTDLAAGDAYAGWLSKGSWTLICQRGEVVVMLMLVANSDSRLLSRAILDGRVLE